MQSQVAIERDLVLVGGGHAHVQIVKQWITDPVPGVALTLVLDRSQALYSGMVPGFVAAEFEASECTIDVLPLARRAGANVIVSAATRIDPEARKIEIEGRPALPYDVASLDVGSTVRGLDLPGVERFALTTRPIARFVERLDAAAESLRERFNRNPDAGPLRVVVVGAGAAGIEIACTLHARLGDLARRFEWSLISPLESPMQEASPRFRRRVQRALESRGIRFVGRSKAVQVRRDAVSCVHPDVVDGERYEHPADLVIWAAGGAPVPVIRDSPLPLDDRGFVRVGTDLRVEGHDALFAVGDCASFTPSPLPKAGVYAVRQGPVLDRNLRSVLAGRATRPYSPQRDFLALLNLGGGRAIAARNGFSFEGEIWSRLKTRIDRGFMAKFQVLDASGRPAAPFEAMMRRAGVVMQDDADMDCGGCAAKVAARPLEAALAGLEKAPHDASVLLGLERPDDAAAVQMPGGDVLLATIDGFRAFDADAFLVGRVAAQNALSDLYAKGATPRHALALVTVERGPAERERSRLEQVMAGIRAELDPARVSLVGGHSTTGPELFVGLTLTGVMAEGRTPLTLDALREGDQLVLTKPLGTGVVLAADMRGLLPSPARSAALDSMLRSTEPAMQVALEHDVAAATDVSGFGLLGHLSEMLRASDVDAVLDPARVPALPFARDLLGRGIRSTAHETNADARRFTDGAADDPIAHDLLVDPQTSGGLLIGVSAADRDRLIDALHRAGDPHAAHIGYVASGAGRTRFESIADDDG